MHRALACALIVGAALLAMSHARAQTRGDFLTFENSSIQSHAGRSGPSSFRISAGTARWTNVTLNDLLAQAYDVRRDRVSGGPDWAPSERFDLTATATGEGLLQRNDFRQMLQHLLTDRFQVVVHRETRQMPTYALVVDKAGSKLSGADAAKENEEARVTRDGAGVHITAPAWTMAQLAAQLSAASGSVVQDDTRLHGRYSFRLDFNPSNSDVTSMQSALAQLGLTLEARRIPVEFLVLDSAEKPSAG